MSESTFIGLVNNAALLVALGLVFDTIVLKPSFEKIYVKVLTGIVFGLMGIAVMLTNWELIPGVIFDTRSVILSVGGLFFGIIPTLIAVLITSIFRFFQSGIGTWMGIPVIIISGILGVLWRHKRRRKLENISLLELYVFGVVVHIFMLLCTFFLPWQIAKNVLSSISLPVMLLYPAGTLLLGKLMISRLKRKKEGEALLESEAQWRSLTESSPDQILTLDANLNIQFANFATPGFSVDNLIGTPLYEHLEGEEQQLKIKNQLEAVLRSRKPTSYETTYSDPDGRMLYYESRVVPKILEGSSDIVGLTVSSRNITERKDAEKTLQERTIFLDKLIESSALSTWISDEKGTAIRTNPACLEFFGAAEEEVIGKYNLFQDDVIKKQEVMSDIKDVFEKGKPANVVLDYDFGKVDRVSVKNATHRIVNSIFTPILDSKGRVTNVIVQTIDLTDLKRSEEKLKASLKEKETLLHEVHHRVKNNMQVIASLLSLQSSTINDDRIKKVLQESQNRVYAMSVVHETIHGSENLSEIDLKAYLSKITTSIFQSYPFITGKIKLKLEVDEILININLASPIGLIINELMSNSLKYAFPGDRKGEITVSMKSLDNKLELIVMDNGIGIADELDWQNRDTLGLKLVQTLAEDQLEGSIDLERGNGVKFVIKFNIH